MKKTYNERLFNGGARGWFQIARFSWLREMCLRFNPSLDLVLELGCYDGRSLNYLTGSPKCYYGFDANWEGGG